MTARFEWRTSLCAADFPAAAYEALRLSVADHTPFNNLGWLRAAELTLAQGECLHILLGWEADELRLCLPLITGRERFAGVPFRVLHHLGYPLADRLALLSLLGACSVKPVEPYSEPPLGVPTAQLRVITNGEVRGEAYAGCQGDSKRLAKADRHAAAFRACRPTRGQPCRWRSRPGLQRTGVAPVSECPRPGVSRPGSLCLGFPARITYCLLDQRMQFGALLLGLPGQ